MYKAFPSGQYENWSKCQALFPHAEAEVLCRPKNTDHLTRWATVLYNAAWYAAECGRYGPAEIMDRGCVEARGVVLGKEHPSTLASMNNLALVLQVSAKANSL
jgi:hypothetical protein